MTAYALLTYTRRRDFAGAVPIVKWIVSQRNSRGGFSSTQVITDRLPVLLYIASSASAYIPNIFSHWSTRVVWAHA